MSAASIRRDASWLVAHEALFDGIDADSISPVPWGGGFSSIIRLILGQQVSMEAADAMFSRLEAELRTVDPAGILSLDTAVMRRCGFTRMKEQCARELAEAVTAGYDLAALGLLPDGEVVHRLVRLRGIGSWTAECYLLFALGRRDVFPAGDLALRVGYRELAGRASQPDASEMTVIASRWAPRRSAAAHLVWQSYLARRGRSA